MNQTIQDMLSRRSTRAFGGGKVEKEKLEKIIEAGLYAPSAHNHQPWHFTVISDQDLLDELNRESKAFAKTFDDEMIQRMASNDKLNIFYGAPTAILVSGEKAAMMPEVDCAAATQNMLVAAESLGVGSCWIGFVTFLFKSEKGAYYKEKLGIPEGYEPYYAVSLGEKKQAHSAAPKRREGTVTYF